MKEKYRLNINEIEWSLRNVQKNFAKINETLDMRREPMGDAIVNNMLAGYVYLNDLLEQGISLLSRNELHHLLELNHLVLCGPDLYTRRDYKEHIKATTDRFYEQEEFSISHIRKWAKKHRDATPWIQAAGVYVMVVSQPQLFIEGNNRTGALLVSHILVHHGKPPFVLTVDNAKAYFDPATLAKQTSKDMLGKIYKLPKIKKNFAKFLEGQANPDLIIKL
jgi:hypothetical protein